MTIARNGQRGSASSNILFIVIVVALLIAATWGMAENSDWNITVNGKSGDELNPIELFVGLVVGAVALIVGLVAGAVGVALALFAAALATVLALAGVAVGLTTVLAMAFWPVLLILAIVWLARRKPAEGASAHYDDVDY